MIRPANTEEAETLTKISFESKGYWGYPKEYFEKWNIELTISREYIEKNDVFLFENDGKIIGFYSMVTLVDDIEVSGIMIERGNWLDHMFINPRHLGGGVGKKMFMHLRNVCAEKGITEIKILADPNAKGFYEKMGCKYIKEYASTIENRTIPFLTLTI